MNEEEKEKEENKEKDEEAEAKEFEKRLQELKGFNVVVSWGAGYGSSLHFTHSLES